MRSERRRERGAVAVEFGLTIIVLLPLLLGGMHIGMVLTARHRLGDAVGVAARVAAIGKNPNAGVIRATINQRLDGNTGCATLIVNTAIVGSPPERRLEVSATCILAPPFGAAFLEGAGVDEFSVTAAFPY